MVTELPIITLNQAIHENVLSSIFGDPRTWFLLGIQGFFTGLGVFFANLLGANTKNFLPFLKLEEKRHQEQIDKLEKRIAKLEKKRK